MLLFQSLLILLVCAVLLTAAARWLKLPYPSLLALGGTALAFVPNGPQFNLDPQLTLALFVAPALLDAAFDTSWRDLKRYWVPVMSLVVVAVGLTIAAVAWVVRYLVPDMPWSAAIAIGAIVAPPDAVAASAVMRRLNIPHRVLVIVEGESLLNDATALLVYRIAVAATLGETSAAPACIPDRGHAGRRVARIRAGASQHPDDREVPDAPAPSCCSSSPRSVSGSWPNASSSHPSSPSSATPSRRRASRLSAPRHTFGFRPMPCGRPWCSCSTYWPSCSSACSCGHLRATRAGRAYALPADRRRRARHGDPGSSRLGHGLQPHCPPEGPVVRRRQWPGSFVPTLAGSTVVGWAGMRGIVTLATAYALPLSFPHRDLALLCAFCVVVGTLVAQGMTLRPLILSLGLTDDGTVEREVRGARMCWRWSRSRSWSPMAPTPRAPCTTSS
jgi:CPA1 family monovalent cation:H+ antiporter